ncbi:secretin N-terminal domain-containing protein [Aeoliella sp. SH292]|uniref:secretin N-terminal domain-containing protein n=1 Tax=Aeoliella sp. SH292 TaxID=3454464 RepID=UPI003F990809
MKRAKRHMEAPNYRMKQVPTSWWPALVVLVASALLANCAQAQQPAVEQQAFAVQHVDLETAAAEARRIVANNPGSVVFADREAKRLLVQGTATQLATIKDAIARIDQPAAAPVAGGDAYLRAYPVAAEKRATAAAWAQQFQVPAGSRIGFDDRSGQLLVMGPESLHQFVVSQLAGTASAPQPQPTMNATDNLRVLPAPTTTAGIGPTRLQLNTLNGDQLHRRLEQLLSRQLPATASADGQRVAFRAEMVPGAGVVVEANRTTGDVLISGDANQVRAWTSVLQAMDSPVAAGGVTQLVATKPGSAAPVRQALDVIRQRSGGTMVTPRARAQMASMLFQAQEGAVPQDGGAVQPGTLPQPGFAPQGGQDAASEDDQAVAAVPFTGDPAEAGLDDAEGALLGPVQVQFVEGLDIILIRGNKRDVERVMGIINRIEQVSAETVPSIEVYPLQNVESVAMARLLERVYSQVLGPRSGSLSITPLGKPNSLLLVGRPENVTTAVDLIKRIDVPVEPTTRFEVFPLQHAIAGDVKQLIDAYLEEEDDDDGTPAALQPKAMVVADFRTNSIFVNAGPRDMAEIAALIRKVDVARGTAVDEVRIFPLKNALATELAEVLRTAVLAREEGAAQEGGTAVSARVSALRFVTIDPENQRQLESGVLANIRIAADAQANTLVITAPSESMELIEALIEQLDGVPNAEAEIKVFTIVNGDAVSLVEMLNGLFGTTEDGNNAALAAGENSLVRLQFSVDQRTNSIIAAGSRADLAVVYAILLQLDASDTRQRRTEVYRLKNSPAEDVALALNEWLRTEREAEAAAELAISPFEQIEREVVIVPELVSNSLIVSATPRYFEEIAALVDELDERPAMVMIQVLIAEVRLNDTDEFGVELGLQDSLLFDRSAIDDFQTINTTTTSQTAGGATVTTEQQTVINSSLAPGFNFNNQPLGNNGSTNALANAGNVAAQGLSNFALNRVNPDLGFGGFVFSASSNSVSTLLRALQESRRLEVLSRPQITALDNQQAIIQVGQRVPRVQGTSITTFGQQNTVVYEPVGIILQVRPRVSPDGMVVMEIQAEKSQVGSEAEGIPIFTGVDGSVVRAPRIDQITAYSTVAAASGQTIVLSGLLTKRTFDVHRSVPILSQIPLIGDLFRYDGVSEERTELLIILTPRVIRSELDAEMIKQVESARMSWVLCDVIRMHGPSGLKSRCDDWSGAEAESLYPTHVPTEQEMEIQLEPTPTMAEPVMEGPIMPPGSVPPPQRIQVILPESQSSTDPTWQTYQEPTPASYTENGVQVIPPTK